MENEKVSAPTGFKGTPGPWDVIPVFILQSDKEAIHFSEYRIREFGGGKDYVQRSREEAEANAKLIASAPELGAKLSDLHWKFRRGGWRPTLEEMNEIEALLKKAGLKP